MISSNSPEYDSMFEDEEESSKEKGDENVEDSISVCTECILDTEYDSVVGDDEIISNDDIEIFFEKNSTQFSIDAFTSHEDSERIPAAVGLIDCVSQRKITPAYSSYSSAVLPSADHSTYTLFDNNARMEYQLNTSDNKIENYQSVSEQSSFSDSRKRSFSSLVSIIQNQKKVPTTLISTTTNSTSACNSSILPLMNEITSLSGDPFTLQDHTSSFRHSNNSYPVVHMGLFWESMLSWEFLEDLNSFIQSSNSYIPNSQTKKMDTYRNTSNITNKDTKYVRSKFGEENRTTKPLPNQFHSPEQYKALWAPLHILEVKSQILSTITMDASTAYNPALLPVTIANMKIDQHVAHRIVLTLKLRNRESSTNRNDFSLNEWVLLSSDAVALAKAFRGTYDTELTLSQNRTPSAVTSFTNDSSSPFIANRKAIVALVSERSRTVDGLKLTVLHRLIRPVSISTTTEFYLFRLGSNITAIREFNALSDFDNLPLMKYILNKPSLSDVPLANALSHGKQNLFNIERRQRKENNTLGKDGLGIGFRIFINSKFNASQKEAITAAAAEYGQGGFTLVKGPPGSGKTTTLIAIINALHLRQYQRYYTEVEQITVKSDVVENNQLVENLMFSARLKPRILVCAPSNAAVDYVVLKILKDRFIDGNGGKYNPSIIRVGSGHSASVALVSLQSKLDTTIEMCSNIEKTKIAMDECRKELARIDGEISNLQRRIRALIASCPYKLGKDWEVRIDEKTFDETGRIIFVNHKSKSASLTCPPPPSNKDDASFLVDMPHYRSCMDLLVKFVERRCNQCSKLDRLNLISNALDNNLTQSSDFLQQLETKIIDSTDIILTTLGSTGSRSMEYAKGFEVIVIDEAAQSSEISSLTALQLGSSHAILVGDPQQLPATIFSISGRFTKFDRSLFQRLEESGHVVHTLNTQYRCNPVISSFPRRIFYDGSLLDGPNVLKSDYGGPLRTAISLKFPILKPLTIFDLNSTEERECTSLSNIEEAYFALHLFCSLNDATNGILLEQRFVCVITPYSQQVSLLNKIFKAKLGNHFSRGLIEINTIDSFQGSEREIVIFSAVRATNKVCGIGFLNDVRRMNVALTRAKHYLFVIARCNTILVNPYWHKLISYAQEYQGVLAVEKTCKTNEGIFHFPDLNTLEISNPASRIETMSRLHPSLDIPRDCKSQIYSKKRKSNHKSVLLNQNKKDTSAGNSISVANSTSTVVFAKHEDVHCIKNKTLATKFKRMYRI